jgi:hypothetical protein
VSANTALTYEDYVAIPADWLRHEIIDGEHIVNRAPNLYHQHVSRHLQLPRRIHHDCRSACPSRYAASLVAET